MTVKLPSMLPSFAYESIHDRWKASHVDQTQCQKSDHAAQEPDASCGQTDYFNAEAKGGQIVLTPVRFILADSVRAKLAELGMTDADMTAAADWARTQAPTT